jgi:hypothetical protein
MDPVRNSNDANRTNAESVYITYMCLFLSHILNFSHSGGWKLVHSARRPLLAYCTCPGWLWWWRTWWNEDWQGKPKYSEKTCPSATLSTTNPTCQTRARTRAAAVGSHYPYCIKKNSLVASCPRAYPSHPPGSLLNRLYRILRKLENQNASRSSELWKAVKERNWRIVSVFSLLLL